MTKLQDAAAIYMGDAAVGKVMLGTTQVWTPPSLVPIVIEQSTKGSVSSSGNITLTLNSVKAGSTLILLTFNVQPGTSYPAPTVTGAVVSADLVATQDEGADISGYGVKPRAYAAHGVTAGNKSVTVAMSGENYSTAVLIEVSGLQAAAPDLVHTSGHGASGSAVSTGTTTTTTYVNCLVLAYCTLQANNSNTTFTVPSGYTRVQFHVDGTNTADCAVDAKVVAAIGTQSAAWTCNQSGEWVASLLAFKGLAS